MKRKILSILLIIFMLSASVITIPVNAKILNEGDDSWVWEIDTFTNGGVVEENATYDTIEGYLKVHYVGYENLTKSDITTIWLADDGGASGSYSIKDLSGLYDFPNLKNLVLFNIDNETTQAALDALDFSRLTNIEKLHVEGTKINNLEIGELTNLTYLYIVDPFVHLSIEELYINMDLSNLNNLTHYSYHISNLPEEVFNDDIDKIASYITAPSGWGVYYQGAGGANGVAFVTFSLIEKLNINISTNKTKYAVGEPVRVTVAWDKPLQATEYVLDFDSTTLEFVDVSIDEDFYNTNYLSDGEIHVNWVELNEFDEYEMTFLFNAIAESDQSVFNVSIFKLATGELDTQFVVDGSMETAITISSTDYVKDNASIQTDYTNIDGEDFDLLSGLQLTDNKVTLQDLLNLDAFDDGITVKAYTNDGTEITSTEGLGTGSVIKLYEGDEVVRELDVIVYGDVSGDGEITSLDALTIIKVKNEKIPYDSVSTICKAAGQVFTGHQDVHGPSAIDALAIIKHLNGKYEITQNY